jgi:hypothetical protein
MTITKLIARYKEMNPTGHFFSKDTLKFFGQTLKDFEVLATEDPNVYVLNHTIWFNSSTPFYKTNTFNWETGELSFSQERK